MAKTMKPKAMPKVQPKKAPTLKQPAMKSGFGKDKGFKGKSC